MGKEQWFYTQNGQEYGPVSSAMLKELAASGQLRPEDFLWREGLGEWVQARKTKLFKARDAEAAPLAPAPPRPATPMQALGGEAPAMIAPPAFAEAPTLVASAPLEYQQGVAEERACLRSAPYWITAAVLLVAFAAPALEPVRQGPPPFTFTTIRAILAEETTWQERVLLSQPLFVVVLAALLARWRGKLRPWALLLAVLAPLLLVYVVQPPFRWWPRDLWMLKCARGIYPLASLLAMLAGTWWFIYRPRHAGGASLAFFGGFLDLMTLAVPWDQSGGGELREAIDLITGAISFSGTKLERMLFLVVVALQVVCAILCVLLLARRRRAVGVAALWVLIALIVMILALYGYTECRPYDGKLSADVIKPALSAGKYAAWFGGMVMALVVSLTDLFVQSTPRQENLATSASVSS